MDPLCTSFPLALRRITRSRAARALVCVLAIALVAMNVMAAAMPLTDGETHGANGATAAMPHASHAHCRGHEVPASHVLHGPHHAHGGDCCGNACTCMHACDVLTLSMPRALAIPSARAFTIVPARDGAAIEAPLLRPPIA